RWSVENHTDPPSISATPEMKALRANSGVGAAAARNASGSPKTPPDQAKSTSGLRGRTRVATTLPASAPTPTTASTVPHTAGPPRSFSAIVGPSALQAPQVMFTTAVHATTVQTQRRERN